MPLEFAEHLLRAIVESILRGISTAQLLPHDRLREELGLRIGAWHFSGIEEDVWYDAQEAQREKTSNGEMHVDFGGRTLDEVLRGVASQWPMETSGVSAPRNAK